MLRSSEVLSDFSSDTLFDLTPEVSPEFLSPKGNQFGSPPTFCQLPTYILSKVTHELGKHMYMGVITQPKISNETENIAKCLKSKEKGKKKLGLPPEKRFFLSESFSWTLAVVSSSGKESCWLSLYVPTKGHTNVSADDHWPWKFPFQDETARPYHRETPCGWWTDPTSNSLIYLGTNVNVSYIIKHCHPHEIP